MIRTVLLKGRWGSYVPGRQSWKAVTSNGCQPCERSCFGKGG